MKINKEKIVFVIFFIITFFISFFSKYKDGGDDLFYKTAAANFSWWNFVVSRYLGWTGRMVPETLAYFFNGSLKFLWPFVNSTAITLLSILIFNYVNLLTTLKTNKKFLLAIIICISFLLINKSVIEPAFMWLTGSINYLWPVALGLFAFYPFLLSAKNILTKKNYLLYFIAGLLSALSMEQMSVTLILGIAAYLIYMFASKKKIPSIIYLLIINIFVGSAILFLAPGNQIRLQVETKSNFPGFLSLSIFNRISISFYWVLNKFINICSLPLALIYLIFGIKTFYCKNSKEKIFSVIAIILGALLAIKNIFNIEYKILPITSNNYFSFDILIKYIVSIIILSLIPYFIWRLFKNIKNSFVYLLILLIVFATTAMITLSPTMDVSGNRTLFLPVILLNILSISLLFD